MKIAKCLGVENDATCDRPFDILPCGYILQVK